MLPRRHSKPLLQVGRLKCTTVVQFESWRLRRRRASSSAKAQYRRLKCITVVQHVSWRLRGCRVSLLAQAQYWSGKSVTVVQFEMWTRRKCRVSLLTRVQHGRLECVTFVQLESWRLLEHGKRVKYISPNLTCKLCERGVRARRLQRCCHEVAGPCGAIYNLSIMVTQYYGRVVLCDHGSTLDCGGRDFANANPTHPHDEVQTQPNCCLLLA
jgi:hypothetical protein